MIKYEELGVKPIITENKQGSDNIRDIHIKINKILYFYAKKYADNLTAQEIINNLTIYANQLKQLPNNKKKDEIIDKLRIIVKSLIIFKNNFKWNNINETIVALQSTINYSLYIWVKFKKEHPNKNYTNNDILTIAEENKRIFFNMIKPFLELFPNNKNNLKLNQFISLQNELLNILNNNLIIN